MEKIEDDLLKPIICYICDYKAPNKFSLGFHRTRKHQNQDKKCHKCQYEGTTMKDVCKHYKVKQNCEGPTEILDNVEKSIDINYLCQVKMLPDDNSEFSCHQCDHNSNDKDSLDNHIESVHTKYKCMLCNTVTSSAGNLRRHQKNKHEKREK
jgi:hypothetical protein